MFDKLEIFNLLNPSYVKSLKIFKFFYFCWFIILLGIFWWYLPTYHSNATTNFVIEDGFWICFVIIIIATYVLSYLSYLCYSALKRNINKRINMK